MVFELQDTYAVRTSFYYGMEFRWHVNACDPDLDMSSMVVTYWDPYGVQVGMNGVWHNPISLGAQSAETMDYYSNLWYFAS